MSQSRDQIFQAPSHLCGEEPEYEANQSCTLAIALRLYPPRLQVDELDLQNVKILNMLI